MVEETASVQTLAICRNTNIRHLPSALFLLAAFHSVGLDVRLVGLSLIQVFLRPPDGAGFSGVCFDRPDLPAFRMPFAVIAAGKEDIISVRALDPGP